MAIASDSYSSVNDVRAMTRRFLKGESTFSDTTLPTLTEVEGFIDEVSGTLNMALRACGFDPANITANSTAKKACDSWVRPRAVMYVELTQPYAGFDGQPRSRVDFLNGLTKQANEWVKAMALGFKREGITVSDPTSQGLTFTGLTAPADRADPDNSALAQPFFSRQDFDHPSVSTDVDSFDVDDD